MQYCPPRGPVQTLLPWQLQLSLAALERDGESSDRGVDFPPISALQLRLLALAVPSLQTNVAPSQCETPPLRPLHG